MRVASRAGWTLQTSQALDSCFFMQSSCSDESKGPEHSPGQSHDQGLAWCHLSVACGLGSSEGRPQSLRGLDTEGCEACQRMPSPPWEWTQGWLMVSWEHSHRLHVYSVRASLRSLVAYQNWEADSGAVFRITAEKTDQTTSPPFKPGGLSEVIIQVTVMGRGSPHSGGP